MPTFPTHSHTHTHTHTHNTLQPHSFHCSVSSTTTFIMTNKTHTYPHYLYIYPMISLSHHPHHRSQPQHHHQHCNIDHKTQEYSVLQPSVTLSLHQMSQTSINILHYNSRPFSSLINIASTSWKNVPYSTTLPLCHLPASALTRHEIKRKNV